MILVLVGQAVDLPKQIPVSQSGPFHGVEDVLYVLQLSGKVVSAAANAFNFMVTVKVEAQWNHTF